MSEKYAKSHVLSMILLVGKVEPGWMEHDALSSHTVEEEFATTAWGFIFVLNTFQALVQIIASLADVIQPSQFSHREGEASRSLAIVAAGLALANLHNRRTSIFIARACDLPQFSPPQKFGPSPLFS
jgi:hypothetical protein